MRTTYTYAILRISKEAYQEIRAKLEAAGYADQFHEKGEREAIDMNGIAVQSEECTEDL